ncbi:MAG: sigma D regulator [Gammaproteobacteria bacterium SHHR-1]|uniref:Rsd/AlgQ family anti-sigma factor n=1 Tax=Magnetovirga frankeli TaxID=947516 RepID=UPI0012935B57|nr:Rsd/AlgQ family anti-sigma factor [gamma proteobacterium SS-5]
MSKSTSRQAAEASSEHLVQELLAERQKMLGMFCKVSGLEPFHHEKSIREELQEFCQILIDYTALLHLEIEERIVEGKETRPQVVEIIESMHEQLVELTTLIVDFNDKYDESSHQLIMDDLKQDLSRLGEVLAVRAELEDRILAVMQGEGIEDQA